MANPALSNRERKKLNKVIPAAPRRLKGEAVVKVAAKSVEVEPADRDGLVWLGQKGRLTRAQMAEGMAYRAAFRDAGPVSLRSALEVDGCGAGFSNASPSPILSQTQAMRELLVVRYQVLRGQKDMVMVMDGVCGVGHTLRGLAGGHQQRARDLEAYLKAALDLVVAYRCEPKKDA